MPLNRIISLIYVGLIVIDFIWFAVRAVKNGLAGKESLSAKNILFCILGYIFSVGVIILSWFRDFGLFGNIIFTGCALLAVELENRQLLGTLEEYDPDLQ